MEREIQDFTFTRVVTEEALIKKSYNGYNIVFQEKILAIPQFDYYKVFDSNGDFRYYTADTLKDIYYEVETEVFTYMILYFDINRQEYLLNVQYAENKTFTYYNFIIYLSIEYVMEFDKMSENTVIGDDELSKRILESQNIYRRIYNQINPEKTDLSKNIDQRSIADVGKYDGIIRDYKSKYFGINSKGPGITDDPIIQIIPKPYFFLKGKHAFIGDQL